MTLGVSRSPFTDELKRADKSGVCWADRPSSSAFPSSHQVAPDWLACWNRKMVGGRTVDGRHSLLEHHYTRLASPFTGKLVLFDAIRPHKQLSSLVARQLRTRLMRVDGLSASEGR